MIDDVISPNAMTFEDFGMKPAVVEEMVVRFVRMFRPIEFQRAPFDTQVKSYSIEGK